MIVNYYYGLYTESAKEALRNRDNAQMDYEVHVEQLSRVKTEQNQVVKTTFVRQMIIKLCCKILPLAGNRPTQ